MAKKKKRAAPPKPTKNELHKATIAEKQRKATFRGFLRYIQRHGASIREIWETERIEDSDTSPMIRDALTWSGFLAASSKGQWRLRRDEHWREVSAKVLAHVQTEAVQAEIQEIQALESMRGLVLERITGNAVTGILPAMPKSLEGAVGAFVQLDKRISQKRGTVTDSTATASVAGGSITAASGGKHAALTDGSPLTEEDISAMSRALAVSRAGLEGIEAGKDVGVVLEPVKITAPPLDDNQKVQEVSVVAGIEKGEPNGA